MKKIILSLLLMLISISSFSQSFISTRLKYDSYNRPYITNKIANTTNKRIVCIIFTISYEYPSMWDVNRYKEVTVKTNIPARTSKTFSYYIPNCEYRPYNVAFSKIIFSDGSYKTY